MSRMVVREGENAQDTDVRDKRECEHGLSVLSAAGFSGSNRCVWNDIPADKAGEFMLGLVLNNVQGGELTLEHRYALDEPAALTVSEGGHLQVVGGQEGMVVSWPGGSLVPGKATGAEATAYRFRIAGGSGGADGSDYVLCVPSRRLLPAGSGGLAVLPASGEAVQLPSLVAQETTAAGNGGQVSDPNDADAGSWPLVIYQSEPKTYPAPGVVHEVELAVSTVSISQAVTDAYTLGGANVGKQFCEDENGTNFAAAETGVFQGSYGMPEAPRFVVESVQIDGVMWPQVRVLSYPCVDLFPNDGQEHQNIAGGTLFTFYWTSAGQPGVPEEVSFPDCRKTLPVTAAAGSEVLIWARAANAAGGGSAAGLVSGESAPVSWSDQPALPAPTGLQALWKSVAGSPPSWQVEFIWQASPTGAAGAALPATHYGYVTATGGDCSSTPELAGDSSSSGVVPAHSMRTAARTLPADANPSVACVEVRALAGSHASQPVRLVASPPQVQLFPQNGANTVIATWRVSQLDNISHFTADLSLDPTCLDPDQVLVTKNVPANSANAATGTFTASFPLTRPSSSTGFDGHICLTEHYTNRATSHTFYEITQAPRKTPPRASGWTTIIDGAYNNQVGLKPHFLAEPNAAERAELEPYFNPMPNRTETFWMCVYTQPSTNPPPDPPVYTPRNVTAISSNDLVFETETDENGNEVYKTVTINGEKVYQANWYDHRIEITGFFQVVMWLAADSSCVIPPILSYPYVNTVNSLRETGLILPPLKAPAHPKLERQ